MDNPQVTLQPFAGANPIRVRFPISPNKVSTRVSVSYQTSNGIASDARTLILSPRYLALGFALSGPVELEWQNSGFSSDAVRPQLVEALNEGTSCALAILDWSQAGAGSQEVISGNHRIASPADRAYANHLGGRTGDPEPPDTIGDGQLLPNFRIGQAF